jgi:pimeloyl-ACP methyl ester carboxylesterase
VSSTLTPRADAWRRRGREIEAAGRRVHLFSQPGPGPTLLLLHGFPTCSYDWRHLVELEPGRSILAPDYPGYGLSEKPPDGDYSLIGIADAVEALVRSEAPGGALVAVAHDLGTSVANELMARDLEGALGFELSGVLLLNGSMVQDAASPTLGQRLLRGRLGPLASRLSSERFFRHQFGSIFSAGHPLTEEEAEDQWSLLNHGGGRRIAHRLIRYMDERLARAERWHGALRKWPGPLAIAWGMLDPVATPAVLDAVTELRPRAPVTRWDNLGHYPQLEDPERVAEAVRGAVGASL